MLSKRNWIHEFLLGIGLVVITWGVNGISNISEQMVQMKVHVAEIATELKGHDQRFENHEKRLTRLEDKD